ncbi:Permease of the drug/metabolite transporter (DMT) superfamily protein [Clostridiaceae bacterium JG1575]|nr:Permease of the drug/metabolite transporter (DMT) superfamily protein [Clostridiaceae bacterium JG1575]
MVFLGELSALLAAAVWSVSSLLTEKASLRTKSNDLNLVVKALGLFFVSVIAWAVRGTMFPTQGTLASFSWLALSGAVGFALGDSFLFRSFQLLGAKVTLLIFSLAPVLTALFGILFLGEHLTWANVAGMSLVLFGVIFVILEGGPGRRIKLRFPLKGVVMALLASLGQALGVVLSKQGMTGYDAFSATQIRLLGGVALMIVIALARPTEHDFRAFANRHVQALSAGSAVMGTVIGVTLSMVAIANTKAAIAATLMGVTPIMVIPLAVVFHKQRAEAKEILGALITVAGIAVLFIP